MLIRVTVPSTSDCVRGFLNECVCKGDLHWHGDELCLESTCGCCWVSHHNNASSTSMTVITVDHADGYGPTVFIPSSRQILLLRPEALTYTFITPQTRNPHPWAQQPPGWGELAQGFGDLRAAAQPGIPVQEERESFISLAWGGGWGLLGFGVSCFRVSGVFYGLGCFSVWSFGV